MKSGPRDPNSTGFWLGVGLLAILTVPAGGTEAVLRHLATHEPEKFPAPASFEALTSSWLSLLIVSGIGFAVYPQAALSARA